MTPFDFVNALYKGTDPHKDGNQRELDKAYNSYLINRALSYHVDTLFYVDEMNRYPGIDRQMHWDYLNNSIKPGYRKHVSWSKADKSDKVLLVAEYFGYNLVKAREALNILSDQDLSEIEAKMSKGGQESVKR